MNNPYHNLHQYCKQEKERAMTLSQSATDQKTKYNAHQAINAWDEIEKDKIPDLKEIAEECISCEQELPENDCPQSKWDCGHHCNHSWVHDECCWCEKEFGEIEHKNDK